MPHRPSLETIDQPKFDEVPQAPRPVPPGADSGTSGLWWSANGGTRLSFATEIEITNDNQISVVEFTPVAKLRYFASSVSVKDGVASFDVVSSQVKFHFDVASTPAGLEVLTTSGGDRRAYFRSVYTRLPANYIDDLDREYSKLASARDGRALARLIPAHYQKLQDVLTQYGMAKLMFMADPNVPYEPAAGRPAEWYLLLPAWTFLEQRQLERARTYMDAALKLYPDSLNVLTSAARMFGAMGDLPRSSALFDKAIKMASQISQERAEEVEALREHVNRPR